MQNLLTGERPYEKYDRLGPGALSDAELLAVILRSGTCGLSALDLARMILGNAKCEDGLASLFHMTLSELEELPGVGHVKAVQLKCVCEISKRISRSVSARSLSFGNPASIAGYYMEQLRHEEREMVYCMLLDGRNRLLFETCVSVGTVNCSLVSPRELLLLALSYRAVGMVLVHNHPSGDPTPSGDDIAITQRVYDAGCLVGISLLDHIVIGNMCYVSIIAERQLIRVQ